MAFLQWGMPHDMSVISLCISHCCSWLTYCLPIPTLLMLLCYTYIRTHFHCCLMLQYIVHFIFHSVIVQIQTQWHMHEHKIYFWLYLHYLYRNPNLKKTMISMKSQGPALFIHLHERWVLSGCVGLNGLAIRKVAV